MTALRVFHGFIDEWPLLEGHTSPAFKGSNGRGSDWLCPACGALVAGKILPGQILDVLIRCRSCGIVLASPNRAIGAPIPGRPVVAAPGRYNLDSPVDLAAKPVVVAGAPALLGYARETGLTIPGLYEPPADPPQELDLASLAIMRDRLVEILGPKYAPLRASDDRAAKSATPPRDRNRLIELIRFAEGAAKDLARASGTGNPTLDGYLLAELYRTYRLSRRWANHPAWPALTATLTSLSEPEHTLMLLSVASYLADTGNGVGLHIRSLPGRAVADMWLEPSLNEQVQIELKTPAAMRIPSPDSLTVRSAVTLVDRAVKKSRRQLPAGRTSILVLGGYRLGSAWHNVLEGARRVLTEQKRRRSLSGVLVADCTFTVFRTVNQISRVVPNMRVEFIPHPNYDGAVNVQRGKLAPDGPGLIPRASS